MATGVGWKQEKRLFDYLRYQRHCIEVIEGDKAVRAYLGIPDGFKCADALGLHQPSGAAGPRRVTVAESKGTDMDSAVEQLGNAAAGVLAKFGRETTVDLLVMVPGLQERPGGNLSPGQGFRADPLKTGKDKFTLQEWMDGPPTQARPRVTYPGGLMWASRVNGMGIVVLRMRP